jgi:microcystin-dependent protein
MGIVNPTRGQLGGPRGDFEAAEHNALSTVIAALNGDVDTANLKDAGIQLTDLATALQQAFLPTGTLIPSARSTPPSGFLACDGSAVSRSDYASLFSAIGTAYGAGNGSTTFNLPDSRGRALFGKGSNAVILSLGANEGLAESSRSPRHAHGYTGTTTQATVASGGVGGFPGVSGGTLGHTHDYSGATSVGNPAFLAVNYFIKT